MTLKWMCCVFNIALCPSKRMTRKNPVVILDYDKDGNIVALEILNASKRVENARSVEYAVRE